MFDILHCFVVVRSKKRAVPITSSLRSNKKVSSLVDKVALYNPTNQGFHNLRMQFDAGF
jgi:hypothetical protein